MGLSGVLHVSLEIIWYTEVSYFSQSFCALVIEYSLRLELEKKGAIDNSNTYGLTSGIDGLDGDADLSTDSAGVSPDRAMTNKAPNTGSTGLQRDLERALVGSLTSTYRFKKGGLVKKTISNGHLHIMSVNSLHLSLSFDSSYFCWPYSCYYVSLCQMQHSHRRRR